MPTVRGYAPASGRFLFGAVPTRRVTHRLEITSRRGVVMSVDIAGERLWLGSGAEADLRVAGLEPRALCLVRTEHGYRLEPAAPGAMVQVNGEALFCKDLDDGDVVEVAGVRLRWHAAPPPVSVGSTPAGARGTAGVGRGGEARRAAAPASARAAIRGGRPRSNPWPVVAVFAGILLVAVLGLRQLAGSNWPHTPTHFLELARNQLQNRRPEQALQTLEQIADVADPAVRAEALALQQQIREQMLAASLAPRLDAARTEVEALVAFAARPRPESGRPVAREVLRRCRAWRTRHQDWIGGSEAGRALQERVTALLDAHLPSAGDGSPDTAADVLFAARCRTAEVQWREYPAALQALDGFLAATADAEVAAARTQLRSEADGWFAGRLRTVEAMVVARDFDRAEDFLRTLERFSLLPEWAPQVAEVRQRITQARGG